MSHSTLSNLFEKYSLSYNKINYNKINYNKINYNKINYNKIFNKKLNILQPDLEIKTIV